MNSEDKFAHKAKEYDALQRRLDTANAIANKIKETINLTKETHIIDFGSGTGLLLEALSSDIGKVTAIDISSSMTSVLREKELPCQIDIKELDLTKQDLDIEVDGIVTSMTMHHIKDIEEMLTKFAKMLKDGGFIAIADLESEDGTFHDTDTGVEHFGFNKEDFKNMLEHSGFKNCKVETVTKISKPHKDFNLFLITAFKK